MSENSSDKQPAARVPDKPPKPLSRDYSALPQKPITLKHKRKKPASSTTRPPVKAKPATKTQRRTGKKTAATEKKPPTPWNIEGISNEIKQVILAAAEVEGVSVSQWLEQLVTEQMNTPQKEADPGDEQLLRSLQAIEQRLERIEKHRGFWSRFWDQVMDQN